MVVYEKFFSVVQDSRMRSVCNNVIVLYGYRIVKTSVVHSAATVQYARKYKIFVYIPLYSNIHSCRTAIV